MKLIITILLTLPLAAVATLNGHCVKGSDPLYNNFGICVKTSTCKHYGGTSKGGLCPYDDDDVKCCVVEEACAECGENGCSICQWTNQPCDMYWLSSKTFLAAKGT